MKILNSLYGVLSQVLILKKVNCLGSRTTYRDIANKQKLLTLIYVEIESDGAVYHVVSLDLSFSNQVSLIDVVINTHRMCRCERDCFIIIVVAVFCCDVHDKVEETLDRKNHGM